MTMNAMRKLQAVVDVVILIDRMTKQEGKKKTIETKRSWKKLLLLLLLLLLSLLDVLRRRSFERREYSCVCVVVFLFEMNELNR